MEVLRTRVLSHMPDGRHEGDLETALNLSGDALKYFSKCYNACALAADALQIEAFAEETPTRARQLEAH